MDEILGRLEALPPSKWSYHEKFLCQELRMSAKDGLGVHTQLGQLLTGLDNGGWGNRRDKKNWKSTGYDKMDLGITSISNVLGIHYISHGPCEEFPTHSLSEKSSVSRKPRYFTIGGFKTDERIGTALQCVIVRSVTGESKGGDEVSKQRRQENWLLWYQKDDKMREFELVDLPLIAKEFADAWDVTIEEDNKGRIPRRILASVGIEIRQILRCCNRIPSKTRFGSSMVDHQVGVPTSKLITPPVNKRKRSQEDGSQENDTQEDDTAEDSTKKQCATPSLGLPPSLTLSVLRGHLISPGDLTELAAIEYAVHLIFSKKLSVKLATDSFQHARVPKPKSISLEDLHEVRPTLQSSILRNVSQARQELLDPLPVGIFRPEKSDMLHAWISDGKRYTDGERLPSVNYEMHLESNKLWLMDRAAHYIRHIVYCYKLAPSRFPSLMNCFSVLLLGRPLAQHEFPSASTLRSRFTRLHLIDSHRFAVKFEIYITGRDQYGFHRLWYMVTDDSKHLDRSRHVCLQSAHREEEEDQPSSNKSPNPCIRLLTASVAASKDSDGNASLNYSAATQCHSIHVCALFGGAVTDNAPDALKETKKTFHLFQDDVKANPEVSHLRNMYGVERRHITNGDMYHIDNLIATWASNCAFGQTDRGEHSQVHHRQLLQSRTTSRAGRERRF
jgi:hypothetical protein